MKIHTKVINGFNWEYWYDRSFKCWFAMKVNDNGDQIEDSVNGYTKEDVLYAMNQESY